MGFSRRRPGKDGRPRYTAYYRDLRGREVSAGALARKADADAAWQAADVNARAGLRHDPGRGRQRFGHYAEAVWLPNHRMELSTPNSRRRDPPAPAHRCVQQPAWSPARTNQTGETGLPLSSGLADATRPVSP